MKDIEGFEGLYGIQCDGRVLNLKRNKYIANYKSKITGYIHISLWKENKMYCKLLHRILAQTFISNPKNLPQVNHKNGTKTDNRVENLEWCTASQNAIHAIETGLIKNLGENHHRAKLSDCEVLRIRNTPRNIEYTRALAKEFNVSTSYINRIANSKYRRRYLVSKKPKNRRVAVFRRGHSCM